MAQQNINVGTVANDGTGDELRASQIKANSNFTELYENKVDKVSGKGLSANDYTDLEKTKLSSIEEGAEVNVQPDFLQSDNTAADYIKNKPDSLYAAVGYFQHNDSATQTTPLSVVAGVEKKLTNDTLGTFTNLSQAPYTVSNDWDSVANSFDFSQMSVGDTIDLRVDLLLTTLSVDTNYKIILRVGVGSAYEYDIIVFRGNQKAIATNLQIVGEVGFSLDYDEHLTNPANLYILTDKNATLKINGWYSRILLKSVNIIDFSDELLKKKSESSKYKDIVLSGSDNVINLQPDGSSYYEFQNAGLVSLKGFSYALLDVAPSPEYPYEGKDFFIKNSTGGSFILKHDVISGTEITFLLSGGIDAEIPDGGVIWFKIVNGIVEAEEIYRSWSDFYTLEETFTGRYFLGEKIYSKTIALPASVAGVITVTHNLGIKRYLKNEFLLDPNNYNDEKVNVSDINSYIDRINISINAIEFESGVADYYDYVILEYTKLS